MVGGNLSTVLFTSDLNATGTAPKPRAAAFAPNFFFNFTDSEFNTMNGIAINPNTGNVYITNVNGTQHKVLIFDSTGTRLSEIGGATGTGNYQFNTPIGIAVNSSGYIFVVDSGNSCFKVYNSSGGFVFKIGTAGAGNGQFRTPTSVAVNVSGYIYVSDSGQGGTRPRMQIFTPAGVWQSSFIFNPTTNNAGSLAINSTGQVYVARSNLNDVRVYNCSGTLLYTIDGTFDALRGVAINSTGHAHVADAGIYDVVHVYDNAGIFRYDLGGTGTQSGEMSEPSAVAINPATNFLYELDDGNNRVQIFGTAPPSGLSITINGGAAKTTTRSVTLTIAATYASEICFSNDGSTWTPWEPFATTKEWTLTDGNGVKTVYFKVRGDSESAPASTTITLEINGGGGGEIPLDFLTGFLISEYIVFGALFVAFAVSEVVIPKLKKRREEPTRLKAVNKNLDKR